jgi:hypothetical protein
LGIAGLHSFQLPWLIKKMLIKKMKSKTAIPDNARRNHRHNPFEGCLLTVTGNPEYSSALRLILRYRPGELFSQENFNKKAKKLLFCGGGGWGAKINFGASIYITDPEVGVESVIEVGFWV